MPFRLSLGRKPTVTHRPTRKSHSIFEYRALAGAHEIRVLEVSCIGITANKAHMPTLNLKHINLTGPVNYVAISYMWGSPHKTEEILIDNHILPVSPAQKQMILDLSNQNQVRYLWIDAVCIDQDNVLERNHQVGLMGEIYSRANYVIAYLRGSDHSSYRSAYLSGAKRSSLSLHSTLASIRDTVVTGSVSASMIGQDCSRFINNDYFVRRWIIQEICLARSVIIRCDGYELSMGLLGRLFDMHRGSNQFTRSRAAEICNLRQNISNQGAKLEDLLYNHEEAICRDRLDRVYAMLSLSELGKTHIPVDYGIQPLKLLLSVVRMASRYEGLTKPRTLSFACFLRQHLEITAEEFQYGMNDPRLVENGEREYTFSASVKVIGKVTSTRIDPQVEDRLNILRRSLPSILHYNPIELRRTAPPNPTRANDPDETYSFVPSPQPNNDNITGSKVNAINLWAFSCQISTSASMANHPTRNNNNNNQILAGMSTTSLQTNDEIWQAPRTPIAMIARPTRTGYTLVSRAMMIKNDVWRRYDLEQIISGAERMEFENMLELVKEGDDIRQGQAQAQAQVQVQGGNDGRGSDGDNTKTTNLRTGDLLTLMDWVGMFAG